MKAAARSGVDPAVTPQQAQFSKSSTSPWALYRDLAVGRAALAHFVYYELATLLLSGLPGLLGLAARSLLYPPLFKSCLPRLAVGKGVLIRHPAAISIGKGLLLDDYSVLDIRGDGGAITIGDNVSIGRFTNIVSKNGEININSGVNVGTHCRIATQSKVTIGESTLIAAYTYIGPGNHQQSGDGAPLISNEMEIKGGVSIGSHVWIGARATILDGVTIGDNAVVGAHSLVRDNVPANCVVAGCPAKILRSPSA